MDVIADRYELGRTLGAGGMARVVEAHDRVLDRQVAVKLLRDDIATDPAVRERFLGEARTAARFNHPNAVTVFDTGQDGSQPWIVMELIAGEDLSERLARGGRLDEVESVGIADAVLAALGAAHADGFVHRDVKPGNIMLLDDGGVKLADFGIAKGLQEMTAGLTATGQIIGTAKYLSPEQVDGNPASPASDVYAMGCVLYEMLTGQPPYTGESPIGIALAHTRDPVPNVLKARPDVSPEVAAVVTRALAKDPAERYTDAGEMRRALRGEDVGGAFATTRVLAPPAAATQVLERSVPPRRRGTPWGLIALAALALLGALFLLNAMTDDPPAEETRAERRERRQEQTEPAVTQEPTTAPEEDEEVEPEPTEAPPPTEPAEEPPIIPTDIPSLIQLLESQPDTYGPKQNELRKGLQEVQDAEGVQQAEKANQLQGSLTEWTENDEIDPNIASLAFGLLEPYASQYEEGGDEEGGGPPEGKGKDKDKDKEDD